MALLGFDSDPIASLANLQSDVERFLRNPNFGLGISGAGVYPAINIFEEPEGVVVVAEIPGLEPASLSVSGEGMKLTIAGERRLESTEQGGFHRRERKEGSFSRSIRMPDGLEVDKAAAKYETGLLIIHVPKAERAKPREITVHGV